MFSHSSVLIGLINILASSVQGIFFSFWTLLLFSAAYTLLSVRIYSKQHPQITLFDATIMLYLPSLSWMSWIIIWLSSMLFYQLESRRPLFEAVYPFAVLFALSSCLSILAPAESSGSRPECNSKVVMVFFATFPALPYGRIVGISILSFQMVAFIVNLLFDYRVTERREAVTKHARRAIRRLCRGSDAIDVAAPGDDRRQRQDGSRTVPLADHDARQEVTNTGTRLGDRIVERTGTTFLILVFWIILVAFTERTVSKNGVTNMRQFTWSHGQIVAACLLVLPVVNIGMMTTGYHRTGRMSRLQGVQERPTPLAPGSNESDQRNEHGLGLEGAGTQRVRPTLSSTRSREGTGNGDVSLPPSYSRFQNLC